MPVTPASLRRRANRIRCVVFDIDGVMTDGRLWLGPDGQEWKTVSVRDGLGLKNLMAAGIEAAIISGRPSDAMRRRFEGLGLTRVVLGTEEKEPAWDALLADLGLEDAQVAMMGDDTPDLPLMKRAGLSLTVADAHADVLKAADWVSTFPGGHGAVREACDLLVRGRG